MQYFWRFMITDREGNEVRRRDLPVKMYRCHGCGEIHPGRPSVWRYLKAILEIQWVAYKMQKAGSDGFTELCAMDGDAVRSRIRQFYWFGYGKICFSGRPPWLTGGEAS